MVKVQPAIILESGRVVKQGELLRIETVDSVIVGRFVNAVMDVFDKTRFNIRVIHENSGDMETISNRRMTSVQAY